MACFRNGGCGPYEMYSCSECPASKPEYAKRDEDKLLNKAISQIPHICSTCGLRGKSEDWCEYHDRKILRKEDGCENWIWQELKPNPNSGPFEGCTLKFQFTEDGTICELKECSSSLIKQLMLEIDIILNRYLYLKKDTFNPYYDSSIHVFVYEGEELIRGAGVYLVEFAHGDLEDIYRQAKKVLTEE